MHMATASSVARGGTGGAENQTQFRHLAEKSDSISAKTFFFFFYGDHLILGGKNLRISKLSEKFRLHFRTNRLKLIQEQSKFGSRLFALFSLFQNSPPPFPNPGYAPGYSTVTLGKIHIINSNNYSKLSAEVNRNGLLGRHASSIGS